LEQVTRTFGTSTRQLLELGDWLRGYGVSHVAMESTGVYWKPVYNLLEGLCTVLVVNAQHIKAVPGRKTDVHDCQWLARLLQLGLLQGSFIPSLELRQLRDLTRERVRLVQEHTRLANRLQKVLEDANIKLASVATDVLGKSGREMLRALIGGVTDVEQLAQLARGRMRDKLGELRLALEGRVTDHHRYLLARLLAQLEFVEGEIAAFEEEIGKHLDPFQEAVELVQTIPGFKGTNADSLLAEIGPNMEQFPSAGHLASWARICPGNAESAGKRKSGKTGKGNPWVRRILVQAAWAAVRTKGSYFRALYHRLAGRRGKKRAIIAVAHSLLVVVYQVLKQHCPYHELGENYFECLHAEQSKRYLVRRLERLGLKVTLEPALAA
jgi:transposase